MTTSITEMQKKLHVPKDQKNEYGGYDYRTAEGIKAAVKSLMADDDEFYTDDDIVMVGDRFYIKSTACFNGVTRSGWAREPLAKKGMDESQVTGTAASYACKRALGNLFAIDDGSRDADTMDNTHYGAEGHVSAECEAAIATLNSAVAGGMFLEEVFEAQKSKWSGLPKSEKKHIFAHYNKLLKGAS